MRCPPFVTLYLNYLVISFVTGWLICFPGTVVGQEYDKNKFVKVAGLEGLKVKCLLQDKFGFMWFGTETGLYRYDGYSMHLINTTSAGVRLPDNTVMALYEDREANLWIGTKNGIGKLSPDRKRLRTFLAATNTPASVKNIIKAITETHDGKIWCANENGDLFQLSQNEESFTFVSGFTTRINSTRAPVITYITEDSRHQLWLADHLQGFQRLSATGALLQNYPVPTGQPKIVGYAHQNELLFADQQQVYLYSHQQNTFVAVKAEALAKSLKEEIRLVYRDKKGYIWLITNNSLIRFDPQTKQTEDFTEAFMHSGASNFRIDCMYEDANDQLWFGTYFGVFRLDNRKSIFTTITLPQSMRNSTYFSTRGLVEAAGKLYIGSYSGFFAYDTTSKKFREHKIRTENNIRDNPFARALVKDSVGNLWMATEGNGLLYFNSQSQTLSNIGNVKATPEHITKHYYALLKARNGHLWLGGYDNLYKLNPKKGQLRIYKNKAGEQPFASLKVMALHQRPDESVWIGTNDGLFKLGKNEELQAHYRILASPGLRSRNTTALTADYINCLYEDKNGYLWIGTKGAGMKVFNPETGRMKAVYTQKDGLANDNVCAILPGKKDELWISTDNGLSRLNLQSKTFRNFFIRDGLPSNEFNQGSALAGGQGTLYFGTIDGVVSFPANQIFPAAEEPRVMFTKLIRHNGETNQLVETTLPIHTLKKIDLHYKDQFFTIYFTLKNYFESGNANYQFAYKLDGMQGGWQNIGATNYLQFAGLPAGNYTLRLKGTTSSGIWSKEELTIPISVGQAFYASPQAYVLYTIIILSALAAIFWFQLGRIHLQNKLKLEYLQKEQLQELANMKSQFFTNIAHELRTPLTLIQGPAEKILAENTNNAPAKHWAAIIRRNSRHMLQLINQLLDLSRLEAGQEKLTLTRTDLILFVKDITLAFKGLADQKEIILDFQTTEPALEMPFDANKLGKALYNLLSNAIKFTPVAGQVKVAIARIKNTVVGANEKVEITVQDTGIGIAAAHLPFIFNRYYRVPDVQNGQSEGTGIGLALVKEIIELHAGQVSASSQPGMGTSIKIYLPITNQQFTEQNIPEVPNTAMYDLPLKARNTPMQPMAEIPVSSPGENGQKQLVLVVEDHEDLRAFIRNTLLPFYQVLEAPHGVAGLQIAQSTIPDVIISDVMMPQMDGTLLCALLKQDARTSHIPVILLTAKASQESRIEGLQTGADIYLSKPFDERELLLHLKNLLYLRQKIATRFAANQLTPPAEAVENPVEKSFLERFTAIVMAHIKDENFSVEEMVNQIGMSRTQLHRKIKAVTGQSAGSLIRLIRLQRAQELLLQSDFTIAEIAYQVGFNSPSYFTESFQKHFGYLPTDVRKKAFKAE